MHDIASNSGICAENVETIIQDQLVFKAVGPKDVNFRPEDAVFCGDCKTFVLV